MATIVKTITMARKNETKSSEIKKFLSSRNKRVAAKPGEAEVDLGAEALIEAEAVIEAVEVDAVEEAATKTVQPSQPSQQLKTATSKSSSKTRQKELWRLVNSPAGKNKKFQISSKHSV